MGGMRPRFAAALDRLVAASLLASCQVNLTVPKEAVLSCSSATACPQGWECVAGRCVKPSERDVTPPTLLADSISITPDVGRRGTHLRVAFSVDEALGTPPQVTLRLATPIALEQEEASDGREFVFGYSATGSEPETSVAVTARLEDAWGNVADGQSLGTVAFDFAPPALLGAATLSHSLARAGDTITLQITLNEPTVTAAARMVALEGSGEAHDFAPIASSGTLLTFAYTVAPSDASIFFSVEVTATDRVGNITSPPLSGGEVEVDNAAPGITAVEPLTYARDGTNPLLAVLALRNGSTATFVLRADESLALADAWAQCGSKQLKFARLAGETSPDRFTFSATLTSALSVADDSCPVEVTLRDPAGNTAVVIDTGERLRIDRTAPIAASRVRVDSLLHLRYPWGADATAGAALQYLTAAAHDPSVAPELGEIPAGTFGDDLETLLQVRVYSAASGGQLLGTVEPARVDAAGVPKAWRVAPLFAADSPALYVSLVDAAGNESADRAKITHGAWVASAGFEIAADDFANPHQFFSGSQVDPAVLGRGTGLAVGEDAGIGSAGGAAWGVTGQPHWRFIAQGGAEPSIGGARPLVLDATRGRLVLLSASASGAPAETLWSLSEPPWQAVSVTDPESDGGPLALSTVAATYDSRRDRVVVVGKTATGSALELWEFNATSWSRRCDGSPSSDTCAVMPAARSCFLLAFDSWRGVTVLHGGSRTSCSTAGEMNDTWEWDGTLWTKRCGKTGDADACTVQPPAAVQPAMAFDAAHGKTVRFGGLGSTQHWEWDGAQWTQRCDGSPPADTCTVPPTCYESAMTFEPVRGRLVLFGGSATYGSGTIRDDLWEWDGVNWTQRCASCTPRPYARHWHSLAPDGRGNVVLVGGATVAEFDCRTGTTYSSAPNACADTWSWDGDGWQQLAPADPESDGNPGARYAHALSVDPNTGTVLLYGGAKCEGCGVTAAPNAWDDTWEWNGRSWRKRCTTCTEDVTKPHCRGYATLLPDPVSGLLTMFGGRRGDPWCYGLTDLSSATWQWTGTTWNRLCDDDPNTNDCPGQPPALSDVPAAASPTLNLAFGGQSKVDACAATSTFDNRVWQWNGTSWSLDVAFDPNTGPGARAAAMAYAENRGTWVLFGGNGAGDTRVWEYTLAGGWTYHDPNGAWPAQRRDHSMTHDAATGWVLLFGGRSLTFPTVHYDDLWAWNGTRWRSLVVGGGEAAPSSRELAGMTAESASGRHLLMGGARIETQTSPYCSTYSAWVGDDTWELNLQLGERPGEIAAFSFRSAGVPTTAAINEIAVTWLAAGDSDAGPGAELLLWDGGRWVSLKSNSTATSTASTSVNTSPWTMRWSSATDNRYATLSAAARRARWFFDQQQVIHVAAAPKGTNATTSYATVASDYLELRVSYVLP